MSRYLTPSKVVVLALISIYVEGAMPTASTIPVLSFILSYLLPPKHHRIYRSSSIHPASIEDFHKATVAWTSGIPGRTIWDLLLKKLWTIDSLDALHVFFDGLSKLMSKSREELRKDEENDIPPGPGQIRISKTSPLGTFVRKAQLEFTRLQLDDSIELWKNFVLHRQPTFRFWQRRNPDQARHSFDANLADGFDGEVHDILYSDVEAGNCKHASASTDDMDKLIEYQIDQMQSEYYLGPVASCAVDFGQNSDTGYQKT